MSKWLSPQKMLDYHIVRRFGDVAEAERQLYLAVVRGDVRARLNGKILGPEWLKQLCRMKISEASSFALPRDIELAARTHRGFSQSRARCDSWGRGRLAASLPDHNSLPGPALLRG